MKKSIPKEFSAEYDVKRSRFEDALTEIKSLLELRLGQLAARRGIRGQISSARVKRPGKLWKNACEAGLSASEVFGKVEDLLGIRIVCHNLSDIDPLVEMIRTDCSPLTVIETKDMISSPSQTGYRAMHIRTKYTCIYGPDEDFIPCEIQIRTLAQDAWARLSRADLYGKNVPASIQKMSKALSVQLSEIDKISQSIRNELNQCPAVADKMKDSDNISPQKLALLYRSKFREDIYKWSLVDWVQTIEEAELSSIGEVRALLDDLDLRKTLDRLANRIRKFPLEDSEWVVYSALVATEVTASAGIRMVRKRVQEEWDEIVAVARHEVLSEMPDTLEKFVEMIESGSVPIEALVELGGVQKCFRCGTEIIRPEQAIEAVLHYYDQPDADVDLDSLFWNTVEVESVDFEGACQYCGYQMSKDD